MLYIKIYEFNKKTSAVNNTRFEIVYGYEFVYGKKRLLFLLYRLIMKI